MSLNLILQSTWTILVETVVIIITYIVVGVDCSDV
jgi:hypothetical protein